MFPPDFVFTSERPHYSLALFSSFIYTCTFSNMAIFVPLKGTPTWRLHTNPYKFG